MLLQLVHSQISVEITWKGSCPQGRPLARVAIFLDVPKGDNLKTADGRVEGREEYLKFATCF